MFLKEKIAKNFEKAKATYLKEAFVQKRMQGVLLDFLQKNTKREFANILELGCGNGFFAKQVVDCVSFEKYIALDIVDFSSDFLGSAIDFYQIDIEDFDTLDKKFCEKKFDLIISNAVLQWTNQKEVLGFLEKIAKKDAYLLLGIFGVENLREIREIFGKSLKYFENKFYKDILSNKWKNIEIFDEIIQIKFDSSLDIFRHLKNSGVNSISSQNTITKEILNTFENHYKNTLTYHPLFIFAQKN